MTNTIQLLAILTATGAVFNILRLLHNIHLNAGNTRTIRDIYVPRHTRHLRNTKL